MDINRYHLIGAKVVEFFHAASLFPQLQFVLKGDDDTFVRVDRLLAQLDEHRGGKLFMGCVIDRMRPTRDTNSKRCVHAVRVVRCGVACARCGRCARVVIL
jgi:hypothetical protein